MKSSNIDRATRLGITLTILGVIWYLLLKTFDFSFFVFNNINIKSVYSSEHIISLVLVTMLVTTFIGGINYIFTELKTFKDFTDEANFKNAKIQANKNFSEIFTILNVNVTLFITTIILVIFIELMMNYFNLSWWISTLIFLGLKILIILIILIIKKTRDKFIKILKKTLKIVKSKSKHWGFWFYILFLMAVLFITYTLVSFTKGQTVEVYFENNDKLPINFQLTKFELEDIKIYLFKQDEEKWELLTEVIIDNSEFSESFYEVLESSTLLVNNSNGNSTTINSNKQQSVLKNNINLGENLEKKLNDGKYKIQILINSKNGNKTLRLLNDFEISGNEYIINKEKYVIEL